MKTPSQALSVQGNSLTLLPGLFGLGIVLGILGFVGGSSGIIVSLVALVLYGVYALLLARNTPYTFAFMLDFLFFRSTVMLSGIAISAGAFMPEINTQGESSSVFAYLAIMYMVFTFVVTLVVEPASRRMAATYVPTLNPSALEGKLWVKGFLALTALLAVYVLIVGARYGYPLFTHMDRFAYRKLFDGDRVFIGFVGNRSLLATMLGLVFITGGRLFSRVSAAIFVLVLGVSFLIGDKFTSIAGMVFAFILPWLLFNAHTNPWRNLKKMLPTILGLFGAIVMLTLPATLYTYGWSQNPAESIDRFLTRIASQGELWYAVAATDTPPALRLETDTAKLELDMIKGAELESAQASPYVGVYKPMAAYMPNNMYSGYVSRGVTLTQGFDAYVLMVYGWLGMWPAVIICALIYGLHVIYLGYSIFVRDPIRIILALKLMNWVEFGLQQGDFWYIFSLGAVQVMLLALAYEVLARTLLSSLFKTDAPATR